MDSGFRVRNEKKSLVWFAVVSLLVVVMAAVIVGNFTAIRDLIIGVRYQPTAEMERIRTVLNLTGVGNRIFNASMPELMERTAFNQVCREAENSGAILGCYTDERIFVYNIETEELTGIRELTTAHELLHAVYDRMSAGDKNKWAELLSGVYEENSAVLSREIDQYPESQKQEELYVRVGTEIKNLPAELERHYAEIFVNQDAVVEFYDKYIAVFREIEAQMDTLKGELETMNDEIGAKTAEYESRAEVLDGQIKEFNECARTVNCFSTDAEFNSKRAELMSGQDSLDALYEEINVLIGRYNTLVEEYNKNVLHGQMLNKAINSSASVEAVDN